GSLVGAVAARGSEAVDRRLAELHSLPGEIADAEQATDVPLLIEDSAAWIRAVEPAEAAPDVVRLYHGTTDDAMNSIWENGVQLSKQRRTRSAFGTGFYTTNDPRQAAKAAR